MSRAKPTTQQEKTNKELLAELGIDVKQALQSARTPREERIIAGFEEIQRFVDEHGRLPQHGENQAIFERLYATRLDQICTQHECRQLVETVDYQGILTAHNYASLSPSSDSVDMAEPSPEYKTNTALLAELGIDAPIEDDITYLRHVKTYEQKQINKKAAEEIANRTACEEFDKFKPLFDKTQSDLKQGLLEAKLLKDQQNRDYMAKIELGDWFIVNGQKAYVAEFSEKRDHGFDKNDYRLRVIYDNRTESDLLLRSLQKALYEDALSRRILKTSAGPLFDDKGAQTATSPSTDNEEDIESGTIYVLRSKSALPIVANNRELVHKIGVTGGPIKTRIANASKDPTYLRAEVEIVASYELFNINRRKLEKLLHRVFATARLDIEMKDRFEDSVKPQEWFFVPLFVIDEAVEKIKDGSIIDYAYDHKTAQLVKLS